MLYFKKEQEKPLFEQMMARIDRTYDPNACAVTQWRGENGYHSTIVNQYVHSTREPIGHA